MSEINKGRMFGKMEGDFVVFLIGMRINSLWKIHKWWPAAMAMPKMIKELYAKPDSGFLGAHSWAGRTTIMLQYWKSFDHLEAYAKDKSGEHYHAWKHFNQRIRSTQAAGVWHETYKVTAGTYENIYVNMPAFGIGKAGSVHPVSEKYEHASQRIKS